jgi:chitin disaccharide deacetylase
MKYINTILICLINCFYMNAQKMTLAEQLGYSPDAKLLIIHADDAGVSHSTNQAVIAAFDSGRINSSAIMVPCPWFTEICGYAKVRPDLDFGIHLTVTSEWNNYKWGGILSQNEIPSLLNDMGYFYPTTPVASSVIKAGDVEKELRAQIEKALAAGIRPSHFDTHMSVLFQRPDLFKVFLSLGEIYQVPVSIFREELPSDSNFIKLMEDQLIVDRMIIASHDLDPADWVDFYTKSLNELQPGLNEIIFHLAYDDDETRAMTTGHKYFEATWRQRDLDYIMSDEFQETLKKNDIRLITWRDIQKVIYPESRMLP